MAALAFGGAAFSAFLQVAFDRIASSRKFIELFQLKNDKFNEKTLVTSMDDLMITLHKIKLVLEDAEDKQEAEAIRRWLSKVKAEVNHAEDLFDEFNTECLRLKVTEADPKKDQADPKKETEADLTLKSAFIKELMQNLEKVTARLEYYVNQIHALGLQKLDPKEKYHLYPEPSSSLLDKSQIFGRDDEKKELIERVLSDGGASNVSVIAITGMGGIGKTTLAQLVYNDDQVKDRFQTKAWVCVSEEYDDLRVRKAILKEVNYAVQDDKDNFHSLQVKLGDNLNEKCFLIILDDIWNMNYNKWSSLKIPLSYGGRGSKIIVTTRNEKVALMMKTEPFHHMKPLPEDQSMCLFKSHAFDNGDHTPLNEFETIGTDIVKKCKGLPLAIKTVAGALRPERDINVWQDFLSSEIWSAKGDILPALSLSYKHLPSDLKCCFAFCALFPKDLPFDKDEVVQLWMANELVKPSTQQVGRLYFEELKSRSFFEFVNGKKYLMHDLINDLARSVTGNTSIRLEDYEAADLLESIRRENELPRELQHFSYLSKYREESQRFRVLAQVHSLRTFLPIHQDQSQCENTMFFLSDGMFQIFQRLRALKWSQYKLVVLPDAIGDLKHLRFLNLASTNIKKLPNGISKCINLQTLILANCKELVELPKDMRLLINLQHFDVQGVGEPLIKTMASWLLRMFIDIQNISVVVDKIHGNVLEHLGKLQLCHSLNIIELGDTDVATIEGVEHDGLIDKDFIEDLSLEWKGIAENPEDEFNKLSKLKPHTNTKKLSIDWYQGNTFPGWLGNSVFNNMESLSLKNCKKCSSLPPLGQLSALKKLDISGMDEITEIGKEFYGDASTSKLANWVIFNK